MKKDASARDNVHPSVSHDDGGITTVVYMICVVVANCQFVHQ